MTWHLIAPTKHVETEAALMQIAAWLWETEDIIKEELAYQSITDYAKDIPWREE